jgi:predicted nucleic acid-binding protein
VKFADTGWWAAWALPEDRRHRDAIATLQSLRPAEQIISTNHVIGETWTLLRRRAHHRAALDFLDRTETLSDAGVLVIHRVTADQEAAAWEWLRKHDERSYSFVDATSFRVMRDRRLREALAFDQDFVAAGFSEVSPPRRGGR